MLVNIEALTEIFQNAKDDESLGDGDRHLVYSGFLESIDRTILTVPMHSSDLIGLRDLAKSISDARNALSV
jgi:hypothetical protein